MNNSRKGDKINKIEVLRFFLPLLIFCAVTLSVCFCLGNVGIIEGAEGEFASISRKMADTSDWITPRINGCKYFGERPAAFWVGALSIKLFGANEFCFRFPLLFHSLDLGNHPVDDVLHLRHVLLHGAEHDVGVNLKVMVGYLVAHPHHAAPVDFGIAGQQLAVRLLVESLHGLAQRNQVHADGVEAHHAARRCEQLVGVADHGGTLKNSLDGHADFPQAVHHYLAVKHRRPPF